MPKRYRRSFVVGIVTGVGSILYGIAILIPLIESAKLDRTGERVSAVLLIIAGLVLVGAAVRTAIYARRTDGES